MIEKFKENETTNDLIFSNRALEYVEDSFFQPDLTYNSSSFHSEDSDIRNKKNQLRDEMLNELETLKELLLSHSNLDVKSLPEDERATFRKFIKFYSRCPLCGNYNHYFKLKRIYFDKENINLKKNLIKFIEKKETKHYADINVGVPCCSCYKNIFE
jgi:hypothetical protein